MNTELKFEDLGISVENAVTMKNNLKITTPTPVQSKAIPSILKGRHVMVQAKTGTGKTLAYVLPLMEMMKKNLNECLILAPTRELAKQIHSVIRDTANGSMKALTVYGGVSIDRQITTIAKGVHIIVGTPGRIIDLYKRGKLNLRNIKFVVLDEADRLWDMGFAPDVKYILNQIKSEYQFMLFSATLDQDMRDLVKQYSRNQFDFINLSRDDLTVGNTLQFYYMIDQFDLKYKTFIDILRMEKPDHALIFVNTTRTADWLFRRLQNEKKINYSVGMLYGKMSQFQREEVLQKFRNKEINMIVATDVAARGLDIEDISHVFNYDVPQFPEGYVHRIGRTSRMNKRGIAITLVLTDEYVYLCNIEGLINKEIKKRETRFQQEKRSKFTIY